MKDDQKKLNIIKPILCGAFGTFGLLFVFFLVVGLISGISATLNQFKEFSYFIILLALGFGIQVGLYIYLRNIIFQRKSVVGVLAVSGTTSTVAMLSCCAHYLVNILPIIGITGMIGLIGQYQIELFWIGIAFNISGIIYISRKIIIFNKFNGI